MNTEKAAYLAFALHFAWLGISHNCGLYALLLPIRIHRERSRCQGHGFCDRDLLYQEWNGDRFRQWARKIGTNTYKVIEAILTSKAVEEQAYLTCRSLLKLADAHTPARLEEACCKACQFSKSPSYKSVKNILTAMGTMDSRTADHSSADPVVVPQNRYGITRGAAYYGGKDNAE